MVHGGVPSSPEIGERSWNSKDGTAGNPWFSSVSVKINTKVKLRQMIWMT
jgi:hypothetical protein